MKIKYFLLYLTPILFWGCQKENRQVYPPEFGIYVDDFFLQANQRGLDISPEDYNFSIVFGEIAETGIVGNCERRSGRMIIEPAYWKRSDYQEREWIIFHELGHCVLDRAHRNETTATNECLSIMRGAEDGFSCSMNLYAESWRAYYLDELFDSGNTLQNWYLDNLEYQSSIPGIRPVIQIEDTLAERIIIDTLDLSLSPNFLVELEFENWQTEQNVVLFSLGDLLFSNCNICAVSNVDIRTQGGQKNYFSCDLSFESNIKLSMIRKEDMISFFVNEVFVHTMDYSVINGSRIETIRFDTPLVMDINIQITQ